jgi:hypothetical protein
MLAVCSKSLISTSSVTSSSSRFGSSPLCLMMSRTWSTSSLLICTGEMLTDTRTSFGQSRAASIALRMIRSVSGVIRPFSSASLTNSGGGIGPNSGWNQRARVSKPTTRMSRTRTSGWK